MVAFEDRVMRLHDEAPLTDIHAHLSTKPYLFNRSVWKHRCSGRTFNPFSSRTDFVMQQRGHVGTVWNVLYLPELQLRDCLLTRLLARVFVKRYDEIVMGPPMERLLDMMDLVESQIAQHPDRAEVARSAADVRRIREKNKIAVVHTVEGAHVLEGKVESLDRLAYRGVAMLTLAHFFDNGIAEHTPGMPNNNCMQRLCRYRFPWGHHESLTGLGKDIVRRMLDLGMLVDVTHAGPEARAAIYAEVNRRRPVVASHVGVHAINPDPYNLFDDEIREIATTGGVIGVIFMTHWLDQQEPKNGLEPIWRTIEHVHGVTGSFEHLAIGTDFDGFSDPPDDLQDASQLGKLTTYLLDRIPEADVRRILGGNAQRVLDAGWGRTDDESV
jgi:membrane dipeptidase